MKKSLLCILLALVILIGGIPTVVFAAETDVADTAADTVLTEAMVSGGFTPKAGDKPYRYWGIHTFDEKKYRIKTSTYYNLRNGAQLANSDTFDNAATYAIYFEFEALDGYRFDTASNITAGFNSNIYPTSSVVYNLDTTGKTIAVFHNFRMSGDTNSCIIKFIPNGGIGSKRPTVVTKNSTYTLPSNPFTAPKNGIYFSKWDKGNVSGKITVNVDTDVTALWNSNIINTVGVTGIVSPRYPNTCDFSANLAGSGYQLNTDLDDGSSVVNGIEWWADTENEGRKNYKYNYGIPLNAYRFIVVIHLKAKNVYYFDDLTKVTGTVNGRKAVVQKDSKANNEGKYLALVYYYDIVHSDLKVDIDAPTAYKRPTYIAKINNSDYGAKVNTKKTDSYFTNGIYWLDLNTRKIMAPTDCFLPGHAYRVVVDVVPKTGYEFPVDYQNKISFYQVKFNGEKTSDYGDDTNEGIRAEDQCWVGHSFPTIASDDRTVINQVSVTVAEPVAGEKPVFKGTLWEKGYKIKSVSWYTNSGNAMTADSVFEAGKPYTVKVAVTADDGNRFGVSGDMYTTNVYVNSRTGFSDPFTDVTEITACYTFLCPVVVSTYIVGDADGDKEVTILDATAIQRHLADIPTKAYDEKAADVDGEKGVSILDATAIQRWLAGFSDGYNIGKPV